MGKGTYYWCGKQVPEDAPVSQEILNLYDVSIVKFIRDMFGATHFLGLTCGQNSVISPLIVSGIRVGETSIQAIKRRILKLFYANVSEDSIVLTSVSSNGTACYRLDFDNENVIPDQDLSGGIRNNSETHEYTDKWAVVYIYSKDLKTILDKFNNTFYSNMVPMIYPVEKFIE